MNKEYTKYFRNEMTKLEKEFETRLYDKECWNMDPNFDDDDVYYKCMNFYSNNYVGKNRYVVVSHYYHEEGDDFITFYYYNQCWDGCNKLSDFENIEEVIELITDIKNALSWG